MKKRIISMLLVGAMLFTSIPMTATAKTSERKYGDVNGDGEIDFIDVLTLKKHIAEMEPKNYVPENADVNADGTVDFIDLLFIKKYIAEYDIQLGPDVLTVNFYDGERLIDSLPAEKGSPLGEVPSVAKSSKENATLLGYYKDSACTQPFYAEDPVTESMNVYAKYQELESTEALNITSFTQMDAEPDVTFNIKRVSGENAPESAAVLTVKDGSAAVKLDIADADNDGVYTVKAPDGFNKGCSYELNLADGWVFDGKDATIRTAAFSIKMEKVENLEMSEDIKYVKDTDNIDYTISGTKYGKYTELSDDIVSGMSDKDSGTFEYDNANKLSQDDIICVYVGKDPRERKGDDGKALLDPAVYVKVSNVDGKKVTFVPLEDEDQSKMYEVPDNFPIKVAAKPTADKGTVSLDELDADMYKTMLGEADGTKANALEKAGKGDFITLYESQDALTSEDAAYYAKITDYNSETHEITYEKTTRQAILDSMDLNADVDLSGDDYITDQEKKEIEDTVLYQLQQSDFTAGAATALSDMLDKAAVVDEASGEEALATCGLEDAEVTDENGEEITPLALAKYNIAGKFELSDKVNLSVELITKGDQLHYNNGVQLAVNVKADFAAETSDGGSVNVPLSATFVQEVVIQPGVRGSIVTKKILFIPVPIGVQVNSTVDIKSYSAFSFNAQIYTVEPEEKSTWEKIKDLINDDKLVEGLKGADKIANGLKTVGDVMTKIEELQEKIDEASEKKEQLDGYREDLNNLWTFVEENDITTKEAWAEMGNNLDKSNIAADLLDMMNMTNETEASTEYLESMQALMDRYSDTVQQDTSWIELVNKEIASAKVNFYGLVIGVETNFIVRTDMSIAIGSNLEYEVGKRYTFWFKIGLFRPEAGNSSMDLIDERFRFQFYCMGRIGVKTGVNARLYVAIGSGKLASVGISAEMGPYVKLYGFFVYEYEKMRPKNTAYASTSERMAGALFMEFGLYFSLGFDANALGNLFSYSYDFINSEIPLLTAGRARYYYNNAYSPEPDEKVIVKDEDGNSTNGISMKAPDTVFALSYMDLNTGIQGKEPVRTGNNTVSYDKYNVTLSNSHFKFDEATGKISVEVPEGERYMECDMTITYLGNKLAFSQYDMTVTVPLVWTNLSTAELSEYYTASVRVGNDVDGYQTVWSKKLIKNKSFDLPTDDEIKALIGWNDDKYEVGTGYGDVQTKGQTLIDNKVFDYNVNYKKYKVSVNGIQKEDGTTESRDYYARFGETFDFSDLADTKTCDKINNKYTKFAKLTTKATVVGGSTFDLTAKINSAMAATLKDGVSATANYVDNSAKITFVFTGIKHDDVSQTIEKGTTPDLTEVETIVSDEGMAIKDISPEFGRADADTTYQVVCGELVGPEATIEFDCNGGSSVAPVKKVEGSLVGKLPTPTRDGYTFGGWFTDNGTFKKEFTERKMPSGTTKLYAKWTANEYTVTFKVNGGNELEADKQTKKLTFDKTYGELPTPEKTGYGFRGWFTAADGGDEITADTVVKITANQTLYAHWEKLVDISKDVFDFGEAETFTYEKGVQREVEYTFNADKLPEESKLTADDFTFKFMRQGDSDYVEKPLKAGTYNVTVARKGDNTYAKFEQTYDAVMTINKADRTIEADGEVVDAGYTYLEVKGKIDDLDPNAKIAYFGNSVKGGEDLSVVYENKKNRAERLNPGATYDINITITGDENYNDITTPYVIDAKTKDAPTESWADHADSTWYNDTETEFTLTTAEQLAGLASLVNNGNDFKGKTVKLGADIDLSEYLWVPIGYGFYKTETINLFGRPVTINVDSYFKGILDGQNHKITGAVNNSNSSYIGLLGRVSGKGTIVSNLLVDDSYFSGTQNIGAIVGSLGDNAVVDNCVSYAVVEGIGIDTESHTRVSYGGVVGENGTDCWVQNCFFYGRVKGYDWVGGIVGENNHATTRNCANYGVVVGGDSRAAGGIVGAVRDRDWVYNCYNVGKVVSVGGNRATGAIVGWAEEDAHAKVVPCYYLKDSASSGRGIADISKNGIDTNSTADFNGPGENMYDTCEAGTGGMTLVEKLNVWSKRVMDYDGWEVKDDKSYPTLKDSPIR